MRVLVSFQFILLMMNGFVKANKQVSRLPDTLMAGNEKPLSSDDAMKFVSHHCASTTTKMSSLLAHTKHQLSQIEYSQLPEKVKEYIAAHPYQTAFHIVNGVVFINPTLLSGPLLSLLGWTSVGPQAGAIASSIQSGVGNVAARGVFATLQSAQMGGYGVVAVNAVTRAGAAVLGAAGPVKSWISGMGGGNGGCGDGAAASLERETDPRVGGEEESTLEMKAKL